MKRYLRGITALSALAVITAMSAPVRAQSITDPNQWIIKAGVTLPTDDGPREASNTWFTGGLEYQLGNPDAARVSSVEALFSTGSGDHTEVLGQTVSSDFQMLSLMYNYRIRSTGEDRLALGNVLFYGVGIGVQYIWADIEDPNPGGLGMFDEQRTFTGANAFIGYEMAANFEIQAKYQFVFGKVADMSLNSLQLLAGFKF